MKSLIDNILDLSRIEAGKTTFSVHHVDISELLEELIFIMKPQFEAKNIELALALGEGLPETLFTDAEKVRQVLKNFLSNALKFTDHGTVTLSAKPENDDHISISVQDMGIGIDKEKQTHIFGAFQQADGSINRRHGGTGLGLTISQQLAHMMGGNITLDSEPGEGSCFTLHLPHSFDISTIDDELVDIHTEAPEPSFDDSSTEMRPAQPSSEKRDQYHVLIVDDDIKTLLSLTPLLESWGYRVSGAGDGEEALETLESEPDIALILMDVAMPVKDGYTTLRQIQNIPGLSQIPVVTMSCDESKQNVDMGAKGHIQKPIDPDKLKDMIEMHTA